MSKSSSSWTMKEHRNKCVQKKKTHITWKHHTKVEWNMKLWGQGVQILESPKSKGKIIRGRHDWKHLRSRRDKMRSQWLKSQNWRRKKRIGCSHHNLKQKGRGCNDRNHLKHKKDGMRLPWPKSPETYGTQSQWSKSHKTYKGWDMVAMNEIT